MRRARLAILFAPLAACVGLSERDCVSTDWRAIGYQDGARGAPADAGAPRFSACAALAPSAVDLNAYRAGRAAGLQRYCTRESGFDAGLRGMTYHGVCEGEAEGRFLAAYNKGKRLFDLETAVIGLEQAISDARSRLWASRQRVVEVEALLLAPAISREERAELAAERRMLKEEIEQAQAHIADLAAQRSQADADLKDFRAALLADGVGAAWASRPAKAAY